MSTDYEWSHDQEAYDLENWGAIISEAAQKGTHHTPEHKDQFVPQPVILPPETFWSKLAYALGVVLCLAVPVVILAGITILILMLF